MAYVVNILNCSFRYILLKVYWRTEVITIVKLTTELVMACIAHIWHAKHAFDRTLGHKSQSLSSLGRNRSKISPKQQVDMLQ